MFSPNGLTGAPAAGSSRLTAHGGRIAHGRKGVRRRGKYTIDFPDFSGYIESLQLRMRAIRYMRRRAARTPWRFSVLSVARLRINGG